MSTRSKSIGFLFGCDSGYLNFILPMANNEDLVKAIATLSKSVESIKDELTTLKKGGPMQSGTDPQSSGLQYSNTTASDNPPPSMKLETGDEEDATNDEMDEIEENELVTLSDEAATFLEAVFGSKLDNNSRKAKAKAQGVPNSRWIRCAKIDPVVSANVPPAARTADRAASRLQQFWLDAANLLVFILEKAEELQLPKEVIGGIQTVLQLVANANVHHSAARRQALMVQLNPKLKALFSGNNFKDVAPFLFGEKFGALAKERLDASDALRKAVVTDKGAGQRGFQKGHFQKNQGRGGGHQFSSGQSETNRGWQSSGNKAKKGLPKK